MKEKQIVVDMFLRDKPTKILMGLRTSKGSIYATLLSKEADCTYSHTIKILNLFRDIGIVKFEKKGRIKRVSLTSDGIEIANNMESVFKKLLQIDENVKKAEKENKKKKPKK